MATLLEKVRRFRRFLRLNVRNFAVIGISIVGAAGFMLGIYQLANTSLNGMTVVYVLLASIGGFAFYLARTSKYGRFDNLNVSDED